jgi:hypothetical protein
MYESARGIAVLLKFDSYEAVSRDLNSRKQIEHILLDCDSNFVRFPDGEHIERLINFAVYGAFSLSSAKQKKHLFPPPKEWMNKFAKDCLHSGCDKLVELAKEYLEN